MTAKFRPDGPVSSRPMILVAATTYLLSLIGCVSTVATLQYGEFKTTMVPKFSTKSELASSVHLAVLSKMDGSRIQYLEGNKSTSHIGQSFTYDRRLRQKAIAACIRWMDDVAGFQIVKFGTGFGAPTIGNAKARAMSACRIKYALNEPICRCDVIDENGTNVLDPPQSFFERLRTKTKTIAVKETKPSSTKDKRNSERRKRNDRSPPDIEIVSPLSTSTDSIEIVGKITDNSSIKLVSIQGRAVKVKFGGRVEIALYVPREGLTVQITAVDEWNNRSKKEIQISRNIVPPVSTRKFAKLDPTKISVRQKPKSVALIIGVENYKRAPVATFASRDAEYFADFARRSLGVPPANIKLLTNEGASRADILRSLKQWIPSVVTSGRSDIFVFFAGHGLASPDGQNLYLLPFDGEVELLEDTALRRKDVFTALDKSRPRTITVFLDTCYSGGTRGKETLVSGSRGILVTPTSTAVPVKFAVFSAAGNDQISSSLPEVKHGLFSYYIMQGLQGQADANRDQTINAGELQRYLTENVPRQATRLGRNQNPQFVGETRRVLSVW
jgi:hypothetical protein